MSDKTRINISIPNEVHGFYKEKSSAIGVSMSAYMSYILYTHMHSDQEEMEPEQKVRDKVRGV